MSLLFAERTFDAAATGEATPEAVRALLAEPKRWFRLQPLVIGVEEAPGEPGTYHVTDRLVFAGISFRLRYRARVVVVPDGVDGEAWSSPRVHVASRIRVSAAGAGARLEETATITAPRPFLGYAVATARAAHQSMLERIARAAAG